jgi:twitching motility protein PilJ
MILITQNPEIRNLLDTPNNSSLRTTVTTSLVSEMKLRKLEYVTLVGADTRIIASANANRTGQVFDPSGAVTDVITNNRRIIVTTVMSNAEFRKEQAKRWL